MSTGKQRILAAFRGDASDFVPFAPNIYLWFYYHQYHGTLPPELAGARHPLDALRCLGADILARWDTQWAVQTVYRTGNYTDEWAGDSGVDREVTTSFNIYPPHRSERRLRFATPHGDLTQVWRFTPQTGADFEAKYWWTEWEEYPAVRYMMEEREYEFDAALFRRWAAKVGDDGAVMCHVTQSPLKALHWLAGPQNASLFIMDHPREMRELAAAHEEKALKLLEKVVDESEAQIFFSGDNLDSVFYPPYFYRDYCDSFFRKASALIHSRGKHFVVHACGRSRKLLSLVGASGVDCLEGVTPRPLGDVEMGEVRGLTGSETFVVNGGMDTARLEMMEDAEAALHTYTRDLFASMGDKRHFIYASSCMTPPFTPWENLVSLRDAAREYGRLD